MCGPEEKAQRIGGVIAVETRPVSLAELVGGSTERPILHHVSRCDCPLRWPSFRVVAWICVGYGALAMSQGPHSLSSSGIDLNKDQDRGPGTWVA